MKTKFFSILISCVFIIGLNAQTNLNNYKYVLVPKKFDFLKEADQYQLNSLTKFLLEKENFTAIFDDKDFPEDLAKDRCLALEANVIDDSGLFKTKLTVQLEDCRKNILFTSRQGDSKEKEYQKAYFESLREAFQSFKTINYEYKPIQNNTPVSIETAKEPVKEIIPVDEPEKLEAIKDLKPEPKLEPEKPVTPEVPKKEEKDEVIKKPKAEPVFVKDDEINVLYAQKIDGGYQLVDSSPKIVMILFSTPKQDVFIVKGEDAIVFKENGNWFKSKNSTAREILNIKF